MDMDKKATENPQTDHPALARLVGLSSREYEHPWDRQALQVLERTPGLPMVVKKLMEFGVDRYYRAIFTGSYLRISKTNFSDMHDVMSTAAQTLDIDTLPDFYMMPSYEINAFTTGVAIPLICANTGCIDQLTRKELLWLLGHELGHIKSQHVLYSQMAQILPVIGEIVGTATLGIGGLVSQSIQIPLLMWARKAEFTADRAGLLACQDIDIAASALMKMSGVPARFHTKIDQHDFMEQARQFESIDGGSDKFWKAISIMSSTHPWTVMRAAELQKWIDSGDYNKVLKRQTKKSAVPSGPSRFCNQCGNKMEAEDKFCRMCGNEL